MKNLYFIFFAFVMLFQSCQTENSVVDIKVDGELKVSHVEPMFWWIGMKNPIVEVMIHQEGIANYAVTSADKRVKIVADENSDNPNYKFVKLDISKAVAGNVPLIFEKEGQKFQLNYELKTRNLNPEKMTELSPEDVIYLIFPDRFANGDAKNDTIAGMLEAKSEESLGRHGGDLQGIINQLDYLADLGITAIWINPEIENNQPKESYHGYAATDFYQIDARFGTNDLYKELVAKAHEKGLKVIKDIVHNHVGDQHWWIKDLPTKSWIHQFDTFTKTTYRAPTLFDPYASEMDKMLMADGWFDKHMPDLNQQDEHLATYLIQNNLWWIEFAGLDAFRVDTYAYPDKDFTSKWCKAINDEYPNFTIFGETWVHGVVTQAFFTDENGLKSGHDTNLPGVTDFQLYYAINDALTKPQGWTDGVAKIYYTLAKDIAYANPNRNVTFLDNHDLTRFATVMGHDLNKIKSGLAFLLTTRGVPMLYYGTEIMMNSDNEKDHGYLRKNFPGGFGDAPNKFSESGRDENENVVFNYTKKLLNYRKNSAVLTEGKLMQFVPENGLYVYFRYNEANSKAVMIAMNTNAEPITFATNRFKEQLKYYKTGKNIITDETIKDLNKKITLSGFETMILELN
jgi:glycosidase